MDRINLSSLNFNLNFYIHLDINLKMSKTQTIDCLLPSPCCPICLHLILSHLSKWHCHWQGGSSQKPREPPSFRCQSSHHDRSPLQFHTILTGPPASTLTKYSLLSVWVFFYKKQSSHLSLLITALPWPPRAFKLKLFLPNHGSCHLLCWSVQHLQLFLMLTEPISTLGSPQPRILSHSLVPVL